MSTSTNTLPNAVDLKQVADAFGGDPNRLQLVKAIRRATIAQSCSVDLTISRQSLDALLLIRADQGWLDPILKGTAENAMLVNSALLYARSTSVGGSRGERGSIAIRSKLSPALKIDHDHIVAVRHQAMAHVQSNILIGEQVWHREVPFVVECQDGTWLPAVVSRRPQMQAQLYDSLRRVLPEAEGLVSKEYHRRIEHVANQLVEQPDLDNLLKRFPLDAVFLFGSFAEAQRALTPKMGDRTTGLIP